METKPDIISSQVPKRKWLKKFTWILLQQQPQQYYRHTIHSALKSIKKCQIFFSWKSLCKITNLKITVFTSKFQIKNRLFWNNFRAAPIVLIFFPILEHSAILSAVPKSHHKMAKNISNSTKNPVQDLLQLLLVKILQAQIPQVPIPQQTVLQLEWENLFQMEIKIIPMLQCPDGKRNPQLILKSVIIQILLPDQFQGVPQNQHWISNLKRHF